MRTVCLESGLNTPGILSPRCLNTVIIGFDKYSIPLLPQAADTTAVGGMRGELHDQIRSDDGCRTETLPGCSTTFQSGTLTQQLQPYKLTRWI